MATAIPLFLDVEPDVFPLDDLSGLPPEHRAAIEAADADLLSGRVQPLAHAEIARALDEKRRAG